MTYRSLSPFARARQAMHTRMTRSTAQDSEGFTLIELVVVVAILPMVVGGISVALISVFSLQNSVSNRISDSNDALVASSTFNRDVQSAQMLTTQPTADSVRPPRPRPVQTQILGLEWGANAAANGGYQTVVSYVTQQVPDPQSNTTVFSLLRQVCTNGQATANYTTQKVSSDIGTPTVTFSPADQEQAAQSAWVSTLGLTAVTMNVNEPGADFASAGSSNQNASDNFKFSLVGLPGESTSTGTPSDPQSNATGQCSFASPSTGTYANQLCFVDFTNFPKAVPNPTYCGSTTAVLMTIAITNTANTLKFCMTYSGTNIVPAVIPTYYSPGTSGDNSEAFLGNNGFYTGITGNPALYQTGGGITTVNFTNVEVLDSHGNAASGWTLVTGDAESTDSGEWMNFTSNLNWSILPNNGASNLWGNACYDDKNANNNGAFNWTGPIPPTTTAVGDPTKGPPTTANATALAVNTNNSFTTGTKSILCESNQQLNKTGTMMVQAQEPQGSTAQQSVAVSMNGGGLEALFLAVLL